MSLLYFHLRDGIDTLLDEDGIEMLPENVAGRALTEARAIIADEALNGRIDLCQRIDVEDQEGSILHSLSFCDAVEIISPV
ncbi:MAG: hypothetical protein JWN66_3098 [Sphingomonas bacterium]|uniref:DUF6894 family protein n=1 Tax=Sphingomonas bacterium TaxID=1895847 RepID=UPI002622E195|nr:hypothetical protein [Sphingomonas bacterium]MDB5705982.1 hypothetical protein [Sphingomonas bacterium]